MSALANIIIAISAIIILFFAFTANSKLGKMISFIILASILISGFFTGFADLISGVDFLNFLESIFRGLADIIVYIELALIVFVTFFKFASSNILIKGSAVVYVVFVLLMQFGVF